MKITYRAAASADGFIAGVDGDVSWLDSIEISPEVSGLEEFFGVVDGLVMGRKTYDFVFDYGSWPYEDKPSWVCTHRDLIPLDGANLTIARSIDEVVDGAASQELEHLWLLGGGQLASDFLERGLITNVSITEMPISLGSGIPLFANHTFEQIESESRNIIEHDNFRQIEVVVKSKS